MTLTVSASVSPTSLLVSWDPSPLDAGCVLLLHVSRQYSPDPPPERAPDVLLAGEFEAEVTYYPVCGRPSWFFYATPAAASSPVELITDYCTRMRTPYPGQDIVLRWRQMASGVLVATDFLIMTVSA